MVTKGRKQFQLDGLVGWVAVVLGFVEVLSAMLTVSSVPRKSVAFPTATLAYRLKGRRGRGHRGRFRVVTLPELSPLSSRFFFRNR